MGYTQSYDAQGRAIPGTQRPTGSPEPDPKSPVIGLSETVNIDPKTGGVISRVVSNPQTNIITVQSGGKTEYYAGGSKYSSGQVYEYLNPQQMQTQPIQSAQPQQTMAQTPIQTQSAMQTPSSLFNPYTPISQNILKTQLASATPDNYAGKTLTPTIPYSSKFEALRLGSPMTISKTTEADKYYYSPQFPGQSILDTKSLVPATEYKVTGGTNPFLTGLGKAVTFNAINPLGTANLAMAIKNIIKESELLKQMTPEKYSSIGYGALPKNPFNLESAKSVGLGAGIAGVEKALPLLGKVGTISSKAIPIVGGAVMLGSYYATQKQILNEIKNQQYEQAGSRSTQFAYDIGAGIGGYAIAKGGVAIGKEIINPKVKEFPIMVTEYLKPGQNTITEKFSGASQDKISSASILKQQSNFYDAVKNIDIINPKQYGEITQSIKASPISEISFKESQPILQISKGTKDISIYQDTMTGKATNIPQFEVSKLTIGEPAFQEFKVTGEIKGGKIEALRYPKIQLSDVIIESKKAEIQPEIQSLVQPEQITEVPKQPVLEPFLESVSKDIESFKPSTIITPKIELPTQKQAEKYFLQSGISKTSIKDTKIESLATPFSLSPLDIKPTSSDIFTSSVLGTSMSSESLGLGSPTQLITELQQQSKTTEDLVPRGLSISGFEKRFDFLPFGNIPELKAGGGMFGGFKIPQGKQKKYKSKTLFQSFFNIPEKYIRKSDITGLGLRGSSSLPKFRI